MARSGFVRILYLYLFALLGLVFTAIGAIRFLDMGLKATIFKQADALERFEPPPVPGFVRRFGESDSVAGRAQLTAEERALLRESIEEYKRWQERRSRVDPVVARRQREASSSLAMILVGLPLYLFQWRIIKRESQERRRAREAQQLKT
jgi:hypothetical protein